MESALTPNKRSGMPGYFGCQHVGVPPELQPWQLKALKLADDTVAPAKIATDAATAVSKTTLNFRFIPITSRNVTADNSGCFCMTTCGIAQRLTSSGKKNIDHGSPAFFRQGAFCER
jgi:hypothetical protein